MITYANTLESAAPNNTNRMTVRKIPIASQIRHAFAQLALLGFVPPLKAQTKSIIRPINGIAQINNVRTQSPVLTIWLFWFSISLDLISLLIWLFGHAPFFFVVSGLHFYYKTFIVTQWCQPFFVSINLPITVEAICSKGLRATNLSTDTKFYAGQNAWITTETLIAYSLCYRLVFCLPVL